MLLQFIFGAIAFDLYPGEMFFVIISFVLSSGFKAGVYGSLGIAICDFIACSVAVLGFINWLYARPILALTIKTFGAFYILYIAVSGFLSAIGKEVKFISRKVDVKSNNGYFSFARTTFFIAISNPAVYFGDSFFIMQFVSNFELPLQMVYVVLFSVISFLSFFGLSYLVSRGFFATKATKHTKNLKKLSSIAIFCVFLKVIYDTYFEFRVLFSHFF